KNNYITPSYLKLDRYFSNNLAFSTEKQKLVHLLMDFADEKMKIILEGIEEETDLAMTKALKVPFGQGFLLGKPEMLV
ncbi:EAL domain-containing protein, partial [Vibrio cholerae]|nr:EAL domain-containing protein [Vibrio cholerae]